MYRPAQRNLITDIAGLTVGHATDEKARSGVTALLCQPREAQSGGTHAGGTQSGWSAAVDVRGGGPGTRETDALAVENLVGRAHAIVLAGGSVFGLAAADGVATTLSHRGTGLVLRPGSPAIPIVPCAVLHDLANGGDKHWGLDPPYRALGMAAAAAAGEDFTLGAVGAGRGAMAGFVPGGIGSTSIDLGDGLIVGALVALNSVGSALMPDGLTYWAWPFELDREFGGRGGPQRPMDSSDPAPGQARLLEIGRLQPGANTTLAVVACNADLTTVECRRVAMMAQDGIARAVRPAHTPFDGDTVFALASGALALDSTPPGSDARGSPALHSRLTRPAHLARIGSAAADCLARAIGRAVHHGRPRFDDEIVD